MLRDKIECAITEKEKQTLADPVTLSKQQTTHTSAMENSNGSLYDLGSTLFVRALSTNMIFANYYPAVYPSENRWAWLNPA